MHSWLFAQFTWVWETGGVYTLRVDVMNSLFSASASVAVGVIRALRDLSVSAAPVALDRACQVQVQVRGGLPLQLHLTFGDGSQHNQSFAAEAGNVMDDSLRRFNFSHKYNR